MYFKNYTKLITDFLRLCIPVDSFYLHVVIFIIIIEYLKKKCSFGGICLHDCSVTCFHVSIALASHLIPLTSDINVIQLFYFLIPIDADTLKTLDQNRIPVDELAATEVGYSLVYLNGSLDQCGVGECNMGIHFAEAMLAYQLTNVTLPDWSSVSFAMVNADSFRVSIPQGMSWLRFT